MGKNEEITQLSDEIMQDLTSGVIPLHSALLKAARLSLLVGIPKNVQLFKDWAKYAEENSFVISSFNTSMEAAKDPNISVSSANEYERVTAGISSNIFERTGLRTQAQKVANNSAFYRAEAYNFALNIYTTWKFGNIAQNIFEKKREKSEIVEIRKIGKTRFFHAEPCLWILRIFCNRRPLQMIRKNTSLDFKHLFLLRPP